MAVTCGLTVFLALVAMQLDLSTAEVRWCANGSILEDYSSSENATQYNDELYACMECTQRAKLVLRDEIGRYECCNGDISHVGICEPENLLHACNVQAKCDGIKQCYDGSDEMGCYGCSDDNFGCNDPNEGPQCLPTSKLCDSVKDCRDGKDETLCPYHGGWCNGYLCGGKHPKCINYNQICDGSKDCLDGSDESNCQYCPNQFRCRVYFKEEIGATSAECIGRFRVCNGDPDCITGGDEVGCHRWQEWTEWSDCGTSTESCTRIRRRSCVNYQGIVASSLRCYGADANGLNENQVDICPACLTNDTESTSISLTPADRGESTTSGEFSGALPTVPIKNAGGANLGFDSGAQIAVAVAVSLSVFAIIVGVLIAACKLKHTGFWRPPAKLPRPSRSNLPGMSIVGRRRIKPVKKLSHPYPIKEARKAKVPDAAEEQLPAPPSPLAETAAMSLRSTSASRNQRRFEEGNVTKQGGDKTTDSGTLKNIGRTMV